MRHPNQPLYSFGVASASDITHDDRQVTTVSGTSTHRAVEYGQRRVKLTYVKILSRHDDLPPHPENAV